MEYVMNPYIVYVRVNERNLITAINSSAFLMDTTGWIEIDRGYTQNYHHAQNNYFGKSIMDERGIYHYKYVAESEVNGLPAVYERSQEEMNADYIELASMPSQLDIIEAQVAYTAMMTDTLLEG